MIVSRAYLDALREQSHKKPSIELTPSGMTTKITHSQVEQQRIRDIQKGESELDLAHKKFKLALNKVRQEGVTKSHFNSLSHTIE